MSEHKSLNRAELADLVEKLSGDLEAERLARVADFEKWETERAELMSKVAVADPFGGAVPMELHVSGTPWANNARTVRRCGATGELADWWTVRVGDQLLLADARETIPVQAYHHLSPKIQERTRWPLDKALDAARTYQPGK